MEYITSQGDTWDAISFKCYGREKFIAELIRANFEHREVAIFGSGMRLAIPEISPEELSATRPPWEVGDG